MSNGDNEPVTSRNGEGARGAPLRAQDGLSHPRRVTPVSWHPGPALSMSEWISDGQRLGAIGRGVAWWIGDWLRFGNAKFGERYVRAGRITGYDVQTLMNMVYVATRFEPARRRERLSWSHHAELAALEPDEQDRWLERAVDERLSVRDLRAELRQTARAATARPARARTAATAAARAATAHAEVAPHPQTCPNCGHALPPAEAAHERDGDRVLGAGSRPPAPVPRLALAR